MIQIEPHTLAGMLGCVFVIGGVFGAITEMFVSRYKHLVILRQLEELRERLGPLPRTPKLRLVESSGPPDQTA